MRDNGSVKDLQPELDDSWLKRACNLPSAGSHVAADERIDDGQVSSLVGVGAHAGWPAIEDAAA